MLAFVFWHWPREGVSRSEYEARLQEFHAALRAHPPAGFRHSAAFRGGPAAWGSPSGATYEDWYVTDGTAGLDPLEYGAVNGLCKAPHDTVAALAAGGTAGLYTVRAGVADLRETRACVWFSKPDGLTYAGLESLLRPLVATPGTSLWMRKMVLGPTPEFCVLSGAPVELPNRLEGSLRTLEPVLEL